MIFANVNKVIALVIKTPEKTGKTINTKAMVLPAHASVNTDINIWPGAMPFTATAGIKFSWFCL